MTRVRHIADHPPITEDMEQSNPHDLHALASIELRWTGPGKMVPHIGTQTTNRVTLMRQAQPGRIMGQTPKETGAKQDHPSNHHRTTCLMREATANTLRGTATLIHNHTARIIP